MRLRRYTKKQKESDLRELIAAFERQLSTSDEEMLAHALSMNHPSGPFGNYTQREWRAKIQQGLDIARKTLEDLA